MFPKPIKNHLRIALFVLDLCLITMVILIFKNTISLSGEKSFYPPPSDLIPELTIVPTLPLTNVLGLTSIENPQPKSPEVKVSPQTDDLLKLINSERQQRGIKTLTLDQNLTSLAQNYSRKMSSENFFSHTDPQGTTPFERLKNAGAFFQTAGENIAYAPDVSIAHQNLMNSEEHKSNILNPDYSKIGIGIFAENKSKILITEVFTN